MPLYEYECPSCAERFETLVRSWGERVSCPSCGSSDVVRLVSSFAMAGVGGGTGGGCGCGRGGCGCHHS